MNKTISELNVITKAKDLCSYVMTITQKTPKQFRFTFVTRMHNLCLDIIENLYRANDVFVTKGDNSALEKRANFQHEAITALRILSYITMLAMENKAITPKQYEQIAMKSAECINLCGGWMTKDRNRFN